MSDRPAPLLPDPAPRPREAEILDSIRRVFAERGFDGASMQELARAAGMSVGNFYRYFPSKAAMVQAMIARDMAEVEEKFACVAAAPDPLAALRAGLHDRIAEGCAANGEEAALWAEINAAAHRKPEIAEISGAMEREVCAYLVATFALATGLPRAEAEARFGAHAALAVLLVKGANTRARASRDPGSGELKTLMQRMIDVLLQDVVAARDGEAKDRG